MAASPAARAPHVGALSPTMTVFGVEARQDAVDAGRIRLLRQSRGVPQDAAKGFANAKRLQQVAGNARPACWCTASDACHAQIAQGLRRTGVEA